MIKHLQQIVYRHTPQLCSSRPGKGVVCSHFIIVIFRFAFRWRSAAEWWEISKILGMKIAGTFIIYEEYDCEKKEPTGRLLGASEQNIFYWYVRLTSRRSTTSSWGLIKGIVVPRALRLEQTAQYFITRALSDRDKCCFFCSAFIYKYHFLNFSDSLEVTV